MGFSISDIFGGGDETEQVSTLTGGQRDILDRLTEILLPQIGAGFQGFQGQTIAPTSPLQQQAFGAVGGFLPGISGLGQFDPTQSQQFLGQGANVLGQATQQFDPSTIMQALQPAQQLATQQFREQTVPFLSERFGATSGASGALNRALGQAGRDLSLGLGAQAAGPLIQGQQAQLNRQLQGASQFGQFAQLPAQLALQGGQLGGMGLGQLGQVAGFGGQQRGIEQQFLSEQERQFLSQQPFANPFLGLLNPALGTQAFENVISPASGGLFGAIAPGLGSAFGGFAGSQAGSQAIANLFGF